MPRKCKWGELRQAHEAGRSTLDTARPPGLDCPLDWHAFRARCDPTCDIGWGLCKSLVVWP